MNAVTNIDGTPNEAGVVPNHLRLTDIARDTIAGWMDLPDTRRDQLADCLFRLISMGARGYMESDNLIVFETPRLTIGLYRDPRGEVSLHS